MAHVLQVLDLIRRYRRNSRLSPEALEVIQRKRLAGLVRHAKAHSPYYRRVLAHIDPERFRIEDLPTLDKATMMDHFDEIICDPRVRRAQVEAFLDDPPEGAAFYQGYVVIRTSGSSGQPAIILYGQEAYNHVRAVNLARGDLLNTSGWGVLRRLLTPEPARIACVLMVGGFQPAFASFRHMPRAASLFVDVQPISLLLPLPEIVDKLNAYQPRVLFGYPSALELLLEEQRAGRLHILGQERCRVVSVSEPLSEHTRSLLREVFQVPVIDVYGAGECLPIARSCVHGTGLHVNTDMVLLEVVDAHNRPVPRGEYGHKVLVTNLFNPVQPIIRYELNDTTAWMLEPCACGSPFPRLQAIRGRADEVFHVKNDRQQPQGLHPYVLMEALLVFPDLYDYQVVLTAADQIQVNVVIARRGSLIPAQVEDAVQAAVARVDPALHLGVQVEVVDRIDPDPISGKVKRFWDRHGGGEDRA